MKRTLLITLLIAGFSAKAQQFSMYGTKTLFDGFENPARKIYTQDTSRQFSFNFFLPNMGLNVASSGDAQANFKQAIATGLYSGRDLALGQQKVNKGFVNFNMYLAMFKVYTSVLRHGEAGFSYQLRSDTYARVTNETLTVLDSYKLLDTTRLYKNTFNNHIYTQTYQQVSFSYRENINKFLGVGLKLSYLSGISYNSLDIDSSSIGLDSIAQTYGLRLAGKLRSSFTFHDKTSSVGTANFTKNPGVALTVAFTLKQKDGWSIYGQMKDIGFIRWSRKSPIYTFNSTVTLANGTTTSTPSQFGDDLDSAITSFYKPDKFITPVNGKAELVIAKQYDHYRATFLASKNIFYKGGDYGLINNFNYKSLNLGVSAVYNSINAFQMGIMGMIKTNIVEMYMGSDQVFKSITLAKGALKDLPAYGSGYSGASIYFGIGFNFGRIMEHPWFSNRVGID